MTQIAIVVSRFNKVVSEELLAGALERLKEVGLSEQQISVTKVPGAIEIPLTAQLLAVTRKYQAIICLGAVILGETNHYDYVCNQVSEGCQRVMLDFEIPVIFGVLTTSTLEQALERVGGKKGHKGKEAADAAMEMIGVVTNISKNA